MNDSTDGQQPITYEDIQCH